LQLPSETNPIERLENVAKVTVLGADEGGIKEERGVPMSARNIDPSHLGIIDPSRTPESSHAGIDQRFTITASVMRMEFFMLK
jgi:DNA-directed RNA polymerase beta subunit